MEIFNHISRNNLRGDLLEAAHLAARGLQFLDAPPARGCVLVIHVEEVARPDRGFITANSRADFENDRADGHVIRLDQTLLDIARECFTCGLELG